VPDCVYGPIRKELNPPDLIFRETMNAPKMDVKDAFFFAHEQWKGGHGFYSFSEDRGIEVFQIEIAMPLQGIWDKLWSFVSYRLSPETILTWWVSNQEPTTDTPSEYL
jgi:hypothetical protein